MTISIKNADETLLNFIRSAICLASENNYIIEKSLDEYYTPSATPKTEPSVRTKEQIIQDLKHDITLIEKGNLKMPTVTLVQTKRFRAELNEILDIMTVEDSISRAKSFQSDIMKELQILKINPFHCSKSINFDNENTRDFIYNGYVMPYYTRNDTIYILDIFKSDI